MNFSNFTLKEKLLTIIVIISFTIFFASFTYLFIFEDFNHYPNDFAREIKLINQHMYATLGAAFSTMAFFYSAFFLTSDDWPKVQNKGIDEFTVLKNRESAFLSNIIFLTISVILLLAFYNYEVFQTHVIGRGFSSGYFNKAIAEPNNYKVHLMDALHFLQSEKRGLFIRSFIFMMVTFNFANLFSRIIIWLKYR